MEATSPTSETNSSIIPEIKGKDENALKLISEMESIVGIKRAAITQSLEEDAGQREVVGTAFNVSGFSRPRQDIMMFNDGTILLVGPKNGENYEEDFPIDKLIDAPHLITELKTEGLRKNLHLINIISDPTTVENVMHNFLKTETASTRDKLELLRRQAASEQDHLYHIINALSVGLVKR